MDFKEAVWKLVRSIPEGKVMTYGQIAGLMGRPRAAQYVGWVLHWADIGTLPYQRVVNRFGGLADGYITGGRLAHKKDLELEGVVVQDDMTVDLNKYLWHPNPEQVPSVSPDDISSNLPYSVRHH